MVLASTSYPLLVLGSSQDISRRDAEQSGVYAGRAYEAKRVLRQR